MIEIAVAGAAGRMGMMLVREVAAAGDLRLVAASEVPGSPALGRDAGELAGIGLLGVALVATPEALLAGAQVLIDFTSPASTTHFAGLCAAREVALVAGTTGLNAEQREALHAAAQRTPIVWAPNMSVGVNVLLGLVERAARQLGDDYDIEIVEAHHRHKKDAPSGTALRLAEVAAEATAASGALSARASYGRQGMQPREPAQIGIHAVRGGDIVGDHTVLFCAAGERVELGHRASSRQTFARGAIRAARWVQGRPAGLYDMQDVLGLR